MTSKRNLEQVRELFGRLSPHERVVAASHAAQEGRWDDQAAICDDSPQGRSAAFLSLWLDVILLHHQSAQLELLVLNLLAGRRLAELAKGSDFDKAGVSEAATAAIVSGLAFCAGENALAALAAELGIDLPRQAKDLPGSGVLQMVDRDQLRGESLLAFVDQGKLIDCVALAAAKLAEMRSEYLEMLDRLGGPAHSTGR